jgi:hypothetical protein
MNEAVAELLGNLIVSELTKLPSLSALAIFFETGQTNPTFYFAYETVDHALTRLNEYADGKVKEMQTRHDRLIASGAQGDIDQLASDLSALPYLHQSLIGSHCNGLLETGYWANPASPVLYEVDETIDAWANTTFAVLGRNQSEDQFYATYAELTSTFWAAIDHARRTAPTWPPIAFVTSFDNTGGDLPRAIITRHARSI